MDAQDFRNLQEAYMQIYEGRVSWHDPKNPLQSGYTPKEKAKAKVKQLIGDLDKQPSEKDYERSGNIISTSDEMDTKKEKATHKYPKEGGKALIGQDPNKTKGQNLQDIRKKIGHKSALSKVPKEKQKYYPAEQVDIYDIILSYLLDEGYVETPEAANAIMVNMSEDWKDEIVEGKVAWHDPENPLQSGYTPKEKSEAKRKQLGVDNPDTRSFEKGGPGEKEYARHGNISAAQKKMSKKSQQPKGKPHKFTDQKTIGTRGQLKRKMYHPPLGSDVPKEKRSSYPQSVKKK